MGRPKALVAVDGVPMASRAASAVVAAGVPPCSVVLVGGDPAWAEALALRWLPDRWPGEGPLAGIATAVVDGPGAAVPHGTADEALVVVVACDQPWLTGPALEPLVRSLVVDPRAGAAAALAPGGRRQPFPSVWRSSVGPALVALVAAGERRADAAYGTTAVVDVAVAADVLGDVDRPEDLPPVP